MLLNRLCEMAETLRGTIPPPMFENRRVRWIVPLDGSGHLLGSLEPTTGEGRAADFGKLYSVPYRYRSAVGMPRLLADTAEYVLGLAMPGKDPAASAACHASFVEQVRICVAATGHPGVQAVLSFLQNWHIAEHKLPNHLTARDQVPFRVGDAYPVQDSQIAQYWARTILASDPSAHDQEHQCVVCGGPCPRKKSTHFKIRKLPGALSAGASLVSANLPSAESHGLKRSLGVPTCSVCEEKSCQVINYLLSSPRHHLIVGNVAYVFWSKETFPFNIRSLLMDADPQEVSILQQCVFYPSTSAAEIDASPLFQQTVPASSYVSGSRPALND